MSESDKHSSLVLKNVSFIALYPDLGQILLDKKFLSETYRDHSIHIERANMHSQGLHALDHFNAGLTSAEAKKLECLY